MMKITGLSHLFKWDNLHNWWLTKYFFAPLYINGHQRCKMQSKQISKGFKYDSNITSNKLQVAIYLFFHIYITLY